jgi:hypothetical protein
MAAHDKPTLATLHQALAEFDEIGRERFLEKYENGYDADRWLIRINDHLYPLKAVWVASLRPIPSARSKDYRDGIDQLRDLGFIDVVAVGEENRPRILPPTRQSVLRSMIEVREIGTEAFIQKYAEGSSPGTRYVETSGFYYPLTALFAASHSPPARYRHFKDRHAVSEFTTLGFNIVGRRKPPEPFKRRADRTAMEGSYALREIKIIRRNRAIVDAAKATRSPLVCDACDFDFEKRYGEYGSGYIEAHHVDPLYKRAGVDKPTEIEDFAMLCANCHRMAHYGPDCLTIEELRALLQSHK